MELEPRPDTIKWLGEINNTTGLLRQEERLLTQLDEINRGEQPEYMRPLVERLLEETRLAQRIVQKPNGERIE